MLNPGWRAPPPPTRGGEMGSSQEGTPPHPNLRIIPLEGTVLLPSFLHLALREHSPPPTPYPGQEEIRSPTGWERGRLWTEAEKTGETPGSNAASRSLPPGGPRGQGKDGTPGERGASFLGQKTLVLCHLPHPGMVSLFFPSHSCPCPLRTLQRHS